MSTVSVSTAEIRASRAAVPSTCTSEGSVTTALTSKSECGLPVNRTLTGTFFLGSPRTSAPFILTCVGSRFTSFSKGSDWESLTGKNSSWPDWSSWTVGWTWTAPILEMSFSPPRTATSFGTISTPSRYWPSGMSRGRATSTVTRRTT